MLTEENFMLIALRNLVCDSALLSTVFLLVKHSVFWDHVWNLGWDVVYVALLLVCGIFLLIFRSWFICWVVNLRLTYDTFYISNLLWSCPMVPLLQSFFHKIVSVWGLLRGLYLWVLLKMGSELGKIKWKRWAFCWRVIDCFRRWD